MQLRLHIGKMSCTNCANSIERAAKKLEGVEDASVSYVNGSGVFEISDASIRAKIIQSIQNLGFEVFEDLPQFYHQKSLALLKKRLVLSFVASALIMIFELSSSFWAQILQMVLALGAIFYCGSDFFIHALKGARHKILDMNTLVALGATSAFFYSLWTWLLGGFSAYDLHFSSGAMIVSFVLLGKFLETKMKLKANAYQDSLQQTQSEEATLLADGRERKVPSAFVRQGDIVLVEAGEVVAVDGVILEGRAEVDRSFLSGEALPCLVGEGEPLESGSVIVSGRIKLRASKKAMDSTLEQLKALVFRAQKSTTTRLVDRISHYFVGLILLLALGVFLAWGFKDVQAGFLHALAVILISCPCALGLAAPLALSLAFARLAQRGILLKNPAALEILPQIQSALFDKTGTLTRENLRIIRHSLSPENLQKLALIESLSPHPIARALTRDYPQEFTPRGRLKTQLGEGLIYEEDGDEYLVGSAEFLQSRGVKCEEDANLTWVHFAKGGAYLGGVALSAPLREGAGELVDYLRGAGVESVIVSGDHEKSVAAVAQKLGIKAYHAALKPEDKLEFVQKMQSDRRVLFVGDGLNDAAALRAAAVSMSFAGASELAQRAGDFILRGEDLGQIRFAFELSVKTRKIIKINFFWAFFYNALCIPVAAGVLPLTLSPHLAALAMCCSSLAVVANSLRIRGLKAL